MSGDVVAWLCAAFFVGMGVGIPAGNFLRRLDRRRAAPVPRVESVGLVPRERLWSTAPVWFPRNGEWHLGRIARPTDPARDHYEVYPVGLQTFRVAYVDLRSARSKDGPLTEPAPAMSVAEFEDMMRREGSSG